MTHNAPLVILIVFLAVVILGAFGLESVSVLAIFLALGLFVWRQEKKKLELVRGWLQEKGYKANDEQIRMSLAKGGSLMASVLATDVKGNQFRLKLQGYVGFPFCRKPSVECQSIEPCQFTGA